MKGNLAVYPIFMFPFHGVELSLESEFPAVLHLDEPYGYLPVNKMGVDLI